jgi:WD40 repeat protein
VTLDVCFSPDGKSIATASTDRVIRVWDVEKGVELRTLRGHGGRVTCVAYHPVDGRLVSGGEQPGEVKLWDPGGGLESASIPIPGKYATEAFAFDASGGRLLAVFPGGDVRVIELASRRQDVLRADLTQKWMTPGTLATFSGDRRTLAAVIGPEAHGIQTWKVPDDTATGAFVPLRTTEVPSRAVYQLALSRDGRRLASGAISPKAPVRYRSIVVWDMASGRPVHRFDDQKAPVPSLYGGLALSPDGEAAAFDDELGVTNGAGTASGPRRSIRLFDLDTGRDRWISWGHDALVTAVVFSRDGRLLATADQEDRIVVWDAATGRRLHPRALQGPSFQLAFSPDATRLAAIDRQEVKVWDVRTGREAIVLRGAAFRSADPGINPQIAWSADGRRLAASNHDLSLSVWDAGSADSQSPEEASGAGR